MPTKLLGIFAVVTLVLIGTFVTGWYSRDCPACKACVQIDPVTVRQEQSTPVLAATTKASDREVALQKQIAALKSEAAARPKGRAIEIVKEVPGECQPHVARQAAADATQCLDPPDIDLINRARSATQQER